MATKLVHGGLARRAASGEDFGVLDGGFLVMLNDLIEQRPDVQRGWLEAELDALLFMADLNNSSEVANMVQPQTAGIEHEVLWASLYGKTPREQGGGAIKL